MTHGELMCYYSDKSDKLSQVTNSLHKAEEEAATLYKRIVAELVPENNDLHNSLTTLTTEKTQVCCEASS